MPKIEQEQPELLIPVGEISLNLMQIYLDDPQATTEVRRGQVFVVIKDRDVITRLQNKGVMLENTEG